MSDGSGPRRGCLNCWVILGGAVFALALLAATLGLLWATRPAASPGFFPTAILDVVRAETATPPPETPTPVIASTPQVSGATPGAGILLGGYIQISGTGGDGLRLRDDPGLNGEVRTLGAEAEVFQVQDGPRQVDGFTWWYLENPDDASRRGWAVADYLAAAPEP